MERSVRVVAWNVWGRHGPGRERQPGIDHCLRRCEPDVVGLQETWRDVEDSQAVTLARALGLDHVVEQSPRPGSTEVDGLALLSRWPVENRFEVRLPSLERDGAGCWLLGGEVQHPRGRLRVAVTHLAWRLDDGWLRRAQVEAIVSQLASLPRLAGPTVLLGDLNAPPDADEVRLLTGKLSTGRRCLVFRDAWDVAGDGPGHTWSPTNHHVTPEQDPPLRLDYVLVEWRPDEPGRVTAASLTGDGPVDGVFPSDHFGVVADVTVGPLS